VLGVEVFLDAADLAFGDDEDEAMDDLFGLLVG
jgi:hypothetical protein